MIIKSYVVAGSIVSSIEIIRLRVEVVSNDALNAVKELMHVPQQGTQPPECRSS